MSSSRPIGVFDSGLGGLTVLNELILQLPSENFVYLGDVARLPYGTKSPSVVTRYSQRCLEFLIQRDVKMVVVACNTASANSLSELRRDSPVVVLGVIEPGVKSAVQSTAGVKRALVLATASTVHSGAYPREFNRIDPAISVEQMACPLFVPLAEEGWFDHPITVSVAKEYFQDRDVNSFDVVVLGCTHYPLLEPSIRRVLGDRARLVHGGARLAIDVRERLQASSALNDSTAPGTINFLSTDLIPKGLPLVSALFGERSSFDRVDIR